MGAKIMACKLLRKCRKEEVSTGVVVVAAQCTEGTKVSWAPYLLNLFMDDCKDAQDLGTKFHYSWLLMLIDIMGWKEPNYTFFATKPKPNIGERYLSLGVTSDAKNMKTNTTLFEVYLRDLQDTITNLWRITPQTVAYYRDIANFKATRNARWIGGRTPTRSGYNCATTSWRVTLKWLSKIGKTTRRLQSSPKTYLQRQRKRRQGRKKHNLKNSQFPRNKERA
jgi:hypothetical protein